MIQIFITGGTLDKDYHPIQGELGFNETHLPQMLTQANHTLDIQIDTLMLKDSLEMTDDDREKILTACINSKTNQILITHGTDTMTLTAQHLLKNGAPLQQRTIVLTGAMRPFALGQSDALFNLGAALMALNLARPGVYIVMNGQLFNANHVQKNTQLGLFQTLEQSL